MELTFDFKFLIERIFILPSQGSNIHKQAQLWYHKPIGFLVEQTYGIRFAEFISQTRPCRKLGSTGGGPNLAVSL